MSDTDSLADVRRELDDLDMQLMALLLDRQALIRKVIEFKKPRGIAAVHAGREDEMLAHASEIAVRTGLDPRVARQVLRAVIEAFTQLEFEQLG